MSKIDLKAALARIGEERLLEVIQADNNSGFCLACGAEADGCEPDARRYECEECGERQVYGAEELLFTFGLGV